MATAENRFSDAPETLPPERVSTGITGLDQTLHGGLIGQRRYLVRGGPGLGKTTLGLAFLTAAGTGERALLIGFQEPEAELRANAASVGIDVSGLDVLSLAPTEDFFTQAEAYDVFAASDVEQAPMVRAVVDAVEAIQPTRVFIDSLTQLRFLSADLAQFRKQVLSFLRFLTGRGATVLFTSEATQEVPDDDLQFLADGIIDLQSGPSGGRLTILKSRGSGFLPGAHQYRVDRDGFQVFPNTLPPAQQLSQVAPEQLSSGNAELDAMLHGGFEAGTVTLITGPTGIGKSTLAGLTAVATARAGKRAAVYQFEEELNGWMHRLRTLGVDVDSPHSAGTLTLEQVEPLRYLADEFTNAVRDHVADAQLDLVVIDSITGFELSLGNERGLNRPLHGFIKGLARLGVTVVLVNENRAVVGDVQISEREISYLADNVIYLRYVQSGDALDKVLGILKKRLSGFETCQRQFEIADGGVRIGVPASNLGIGVNVGQTPTDDA